MYRIVQLLAAVGYLVSGGWGLVLCVQALLRIAGLLAALAGLVLFPLTLAVVPWVALLAGGDGLPLAVAYGGGLVSVALHWLGNALRRGSESGVGGESGGEAHG